MFGAFPDTPENFPPLFACVKGVVAYYLVQCKFGGLDQMEAGWGSPWRAQLLGILFCFLDQNTILFSSSVNTKRRKTIHKF